LARVFRGGVKTPRYGHPVGEANLRQVDLIGVHISQKLKIPNAIQRNNLAPVVGFKISHIDSSSGELVIIEMIIIARNVPQIIPMLLKVNDHLLALRP
jgi:hypothetical protein